MIEEEPRSTRLPRLRFQLPRRAFRWVVGPSTELHNYRVTRGDGIAMGVVNAAAPFLPVFVVRLGGSPLDVSLLTTIPAISGFLLAIPIGQFLQTRTRIVPWYARSRMVAHLAYALAAFAVFVAPPQLVIPVILAIWAIAAVPATIGVVSFYVVMDGAAGPRGRVELMSRRWAYVGLTTAITVAVVGLLLERLAFPLNYQVAFVGFTIAGLVSFHYSRQFHIPQADPPEPEPNATIVDRFGSFVATIRAEPAFLRFSVRHVIHVAGLRLVLPLVPLYYVRVVEAPDVWIGIIATGQALALLAGYVLWRRVSLRRGGRFVLLVSLVVAALYPATLSLVDHLVVVALLTAIGALFSAGTDLALFDELMKTIPRRYGVTFASIDTMLMNAASIVAPVVGAALAVAMGLENALRVGSLISLVGLILFAVDARGSGARTPDDDLQERG